MNPLLHDAASDQRLAAQFSRMRVPDAAQTWYREGDSIASRVWRAVENTDLGASLKRCLHLNIVGTGLHLIPQYQEDDAADSSEEERQGRRLIQKALTRAAPRLDAGRRLTREMLISQILLSGFFSGAGFAVRIWRDDGTWGTRWRVIDANRVETPSDLIDRTDILGGIEHDVDDVATHLWVRRRPRPRDIPTSFAAPSSEYLRIPFRDESGELNVIHYDPLPDRAGTVRSVSSLAPALLRLHHLDQVTTAHVTGKRSQASLPLAIPSDNPQAAAAAYEKARAAGLVDDAVSVLFYQKGEAPAFPQTQYQGADFSAFDEVIVRKICSIYQLPWQVVLCQLTNGNMASSQAALDQFERSITCYQDGLIEQVVRPLDRSVLREASQRGWLPGLDADLDRLTAGGYRRPRRPDASRLRTRQAASEFIKSGGSWGTAFEEMGFDFEDETRRRAQNVEFSASQGVPLSASSPDAKTVTDTAVETAKPDPAAIADGDAAGNPDEQKPGPLSPDNG